MRSPCATSKEVDVTCTSIESYPRPLRGLDPVRLSRPLPHRVDRLADGPGRQPRNPCGPGDLHPAGRIDIASGTGPDGAVKYTDWAIGNFIERARSKPWFSKTVFVIVADHCAAARGRTDLPLERFHIPMIIYAPAHIAARRIETIASQIDVVPTVLALLSFSYTSRFFGQDILAEGRSHQRALMANYQTVGYYEHGMIVELRPQHRVRVIDEVSGRELPQQGEPAHFAEEAIGYYQGASAAFKSGALRRGDN